MADTSTTHLNLVKQDPDTAPDVAKTNSNLDTLDGEIWARGKTFNGESVGTDGGFHVNTIPYAENLKTSASQKSEGEFINRTTGGNASVDTGNAFLTSVKGAMTHYDFVPQSIDMTVDEAEREEGAAGISVSLTEATFVENVDESGTYTFLYNSGWTMGGSSVTLSQYGIEVTGTAINDDTIVIVYVKEERGTIVPATPSRFVSTNWNLYDYMTGTAVVTRYSDEYGYRIDGTYLSIKFATTPTGTQTTITPDGDGKFMVPSDGYLFITGGTSTDTALYMTWSDWVNGYKWDPSTSAHGTFEAHSEEEIDLSDIMEECFPDGMFRIGDVYDEISLNSDTGAAVATSRIMRMEYSTSNLDDVISTGRAYVYDEDFIYVVRASAVVTDGFSVSNIYPADDHGMEMFTNTSNAVGATTVYYASLKNKLERDVLTISQQQLSSEQKTQVMDNIGATAAHDALRTEIMGILTKAVKYVTYSYAYPNISSNGTLAVTATNLKITAIDGYTPVAIKHYATGNSSVIPYGMNASTSGTVLSLRNITNATATGKTCKITITFVRSELL